MIKKKNKYLKNPKDSRKQSFLTAKNYNKYNMYRNELLFILDKYILYRDTHEVLVKIHGTLYSIENAINWYEFQINNLFLVK